MRRKRTVVYFAAGDTLLTWTASSLLQGLVIKVSEDGNKVSQHFLPKREGGGVLLRNRSRFRNTLKQLFSTCSDCTRREDSLDTASLNA